MRGCERVLGPLSAVLIVALSVAGCENGSDPLTADELASRVRRARPDWANYGEDIKAELGATPVARWEGRPIEARLDGVRLNVTFDLAPPWRDYPFGMPILVRDPLDRPYRPVSYERGSYAFELEGYAPGAIIAWVKVRFPPNEERTLAFDATSVWRASPPR